MSWWFNARKPAVSWDERRVSLSFPRSGQTPVGSRSNGPAGIPSAEVVTAPGALPSAPRPGGRGDPGHRHPPGLIAQARPMDPGGATIAVDAVRVHEPPPSSPLLDTIARTDPARTRSRRRCPVLPARATILAGPAAPGRRPAG